MENFFDLVSSFTRLNYVEALPYIENIPKIFCPEPDQMKLDFSLWENNLNIFKVMNDTLNFFNLNFNIEEIIPCENKFVENFEQLNYETVKDFLALNDHQQFCV